VDSYDIETAGLAEREFIASSLTDPLLHAVIACMRRESSLYHQTLKGIAKHIHDPKFYERGDAWFAS
jgi:hypothetical protein